MSSCRACGRSPLTRVLDLGEVPAADHFPAADDPVTPAESGHPLAMDLCPACGLAQLADDDTVTEEPRGVEPQALKDQAAAAVIRAEQAGWLRGTTVIEFGSPHGGTWIPLLTRRGFTELPPSGGSADTVLDSFGVMHEPDQAAAFRRRRAAVRPDGVLLLQFHSICTIVADGQWNALRHGHFAYYSMTALETLLSGVGMSVATLWEFDLYGGTVLVAAVHGKVTPSAEVLRLRAAEQAVGITAPDAYARLQQQAGSDIETLRSWLKSEVAAGRRVWAYGAASRAVALFARASIGADLITAVADASPAKTGRRMPGTDIPITTPEALVAAMPDQILLTVPDLLPEVRARFPELDGRWKVDPT